jgi:phosphoribosylaminoimidazole-succinocarboxamide synthase
MPADKRKWQIPTPIIPQQGGYGNIDADIARDDLQKESYLRKILVLEKYTRALFQRGTEIAASRIDIGWYQIWIWEN